ncbi:hypothetical protein D3C81_1318440 [compost metagenome]
MRRPLGLSHGAAAGGAARAPGTGANPAQALPPAWRAGGGARRRYRPVGRRPAAGQGHPAGDGALQPHPRGQPAGSLRPCAARCAQPGHFSGRRPPWYVLRPRPILANRLLHRWQCRRKRRRRALSQVRSDRAQPAQGGNPHGRGRAPDPRQRCPGQPRFRPAGAVHRLRRHARHRHRSHREAAAQAPGGARAAGQFRQRRGRRPGGGRNHRCRHHPRRPGNDGQPGDPRRRGLHPRRLPGRRGGHPAVRTGWRGGRCARRL